MRKGLLRMPASATVFGSRHGRGADPIQSHAEQAGEVPRDVRGLVPAHPRDGSRCRPAPAGPVRAPRVPSPWLPAPRHLLRAVRRRRGGCRRRDRSRKVAVRPPRPTPSCDYWFGIARRWPSRRPRGVAEPATTATPLYPGGVLCLPENATAPTTVPGTGTPTTIPTGGATTTTPTGTTIPPVVSIVVPGAGSVLVHRHVLVAVLAAASTRAST